MSRARIVLFTDAAGDYTLADLARAAATWTDDRDRQRAMIECYLAGLGPAQLAQHSSLRPGDLTIDPLADKVGR